MKFFDKDFLKTAFRFMLIVFLGVVVVSFVSSIKSDQEIRAGVADGL